MAFRTRLLTFAKKTGSLLVLLAMCFAAVEIAARLARLWLRAEPTADVRGRLVILALGDSFTYGMGVAYAPHAHDKARDGSRPASYPELLQALLENAAPGRYRVVNLGRPGSNSSQVARALPELLTEWQPIAILVLTGTNNTTNYEDSYYLQVAAGMPAQAPESRWVAWSHHLLSVRLVYNLVRAAKHRFYPSPTGTPALPNAGSLTPAEVAIHHRLLEHDLHDVIATSRANGVVPVLATYPEGLPPNPEIRDVAASHATALVDLERRFAPELAAHGRAPLMSYLDSFHCASRGYAEMALAFYAELARAGARWSPPPPSAQQPAWLSDQRSRILAAQLAGADAGIDLECAARQDCALAWFDAQSDALDAGAVLEELAPPEAWAEMASRRLDRLVGVEGRSPARSHLLFTVLVHDHRQAAYELAREEALRHPEDPMWPPLVDATRPANEQEAAAVPAKLSATDPLVHREGHPTPTGDGGLEYATGGLSLWATVRAPADGPYRISAVVSGTPCPPQTPPQVSCLVDGRPVFAAPAGPTRTLVTAPSLALTAGLHRVELSFTNDYFEPDHCDRNLRIYELDVQQP